MAFPLPGPTIDEPVYYSADMVDALNRGDHREAPVYECVYGELFVTVDVPRPWHAAGEPFTNEPTELFAPL
ncbi:MAG TPA: hypothetical protein VGD56_22330 [Gemmatirosa sp.]